MTVVPLGILPLAVLWTLVCFGLGAWTMRALRRIPAKRTATAPPSPPAPAPEPRLGDYEVAVGEVLKDGVITQEEQARLRSLRAAWGLSPADHVHAVARARKDKE